MWLLRRLFKPKRKPIATMKEKSGVFNGFLFVAFPSGYRQYYCKACSGPLHPGPEGGAALNAICLPCNTNHGCLPFFWDRP